MAEARTMPTEFYIAIDGVQDGPMSEEDLRRRIAAGEVRSIDHCWTEGWSEWRAIELVFGEPESELAQATSRPLDTSELESSSSWSDVRPLPPRRLPIRRDQTSSGMFVVVMVIAIVITFGGAGWYVFGGRDALKHAAATEMRPANARMESSSGVKQPPALAQRETPLQPRNFSGHPLEQIAQACVAYAKARGGKWPAYVSQLEPLFGDGFTRVMDVPETPEVESQGYVIRMGLSLELPGNTPVAFEARPRLDGSRGVALLNGRMRVLQRGDPELARALER